MHYFVFAGVAVGSWRLTVDHRWDSWSTAVVTGPASRPPTRSERPTAMRDLVDLTDAKLVGTLIFSASAEAGHEEMRVACVKELHRRLNELREERDLHEAAYVRLLAEVREKVLRETKAAAVNSIGGNRGIVMKPGERLWDKK